MSMMRGHWAGEHLTSARQVKQGEGDLQSLLLIKHCFRYQAGAVGGSTENHSEVCTSDY